MGDSKLQTNIDRERATIDEAKKQNPELFIRAPIIDGPSELQQAGIMLPDYPNEVAYMRYAPQDFIVEEVQKDGVISTIEPSTTNEIVARGEGEKTIYADLVKAGIPTNEAVQRLASALNIPMTAIGTAGIKDANALTAQLISFRGVTMEQLNALKIPNLLLTRLRHGKGAIAIGDLVGNRFTLLLRTAVAPDMSTLNNRLNALSKSGFFNFYGLQRFGGRLRSHWWGRLLLRGDYDAALSEFLFENGPRDVPFFTSLRNEAKKVAPDWAVARRIFEQCPCMFQYEIKVLNELEQKKTAREAFAAIPGQAQLWIYAYMSFLVNQELSRGAYGAPLPATLPIPLSDRREDRARYAEELSADGITQEHFIALPRALPFMRIASREIPTRIMPENMYAAACAPGAALRVMLPRGAYATTLLMHLFRVGWGMPSPEWIKKDDIDTKALFGDGSIAPIKQYLGEYMKPRDAEEEE